MAAPSISDRPPAPQGLLSSGRFALGAQVLPLSLVLAIAVFIVEKEGAFATSVRAPASLLMLGIVAAIGLSSARVLVTTSRSVAAAIACLTAFTCWSFATILWAGVKSDAWDGANRTLLYLLVFAALASWPTSARAVWPILLAASAALAVEGVVTVEQAIRSSDPAQFLIGSRLSEPLGYPNATGALFMTMAWVMVGLASRRWVPAPARGIAFGLAALDGVLSLLTESRGSVFTLPFVALVYFAIVPGRLRSLLTLAAIGVALSIEIQPVLDVFTSDSSNLVANLRHAIDLALVSAPILALVGWLVATADRRLSVPARVTRMLGIAAIVAVLATAVGAGAITRPWQHLGAEWHSFKYQNEPNGTTRFGGLGSNRYDFWRVGLTEFAHHPIQGIGQDNFLVPYLQLRRSSEQPKYPHSLLVDLLSQTGLVGTALFASFLALSVRAVRRIPAGRERELAWVLVAGAAVLVLHGLVDWLWEMPVLGVLGMALLGTACSLAPREARAPRRAGAAVVFAATAVVAAFSFGLPWAAEREIQRALALWPSDPAAAISGLEQAGRLNPLDNTGDVLAGVMAGRLHQYGLMRSHFQSAVDRTPDDWYANLELGIAAALTGRRQLASSSLHAAVRLDPGDPIVRDVLQRFESGRRIDLSSVDRAFAGQRG